MNEQRVRKRNYCFIYSRQQWNKNDGIFFVVYTIPTLNTIFKALIATNSHHKKYIFSLFFSLDLIMFVHVL
jgi:hypothetical protein